MFNFRGWTALAFVALIGCKPSVDTKTPGEPAAHARVDLIPASATILASVDVAAFTSEGYRKLFPWLDDAEQPKPVSDLRACFGGKIETVALGGTFDKPPRAAAIVTGLGLGEPSVVACLEKLDEEQEAAVWSEDADTLVISLNSWAGEVRAKKPRTAQDPLSPVLENVDRDAHAWFAVRFPASVDERLRSGASTLSKIAGRSTDDAIKSEATPTPSREAIGFVVGSVHLDAEGLEARAETTFETRESVDLVHALLDIGFVLAKHLGASPETPSERLAHELALHTTIARSGDRVEARTRVSADVLADAAEQAHSTLDISDLLGLGKDDEEEDRELALEAADGGQEGPLHVLVSEAAWGNDPAQDYEELVSDACESLADHVYRLEDCEWRLELGLELGDDAMERVVRCIAEASDRASIFACDPDRLLNSDVAEQRAFDLEASRAKIRQERAGRALREAFAAAETEAEEKALYAEICGRMAALSQGDTDDCLAEAKTAHREDPETYEASAVCALLHDTVYGHLNCLSTTELP